MNWEVISNDRSSLMEYRLIDQNDCVLTLKYNPLHHSARITSGTSHRLFYFESAGSLSGKTIFKNEYGMEIGNLVHDKYHPEVGSLVIDSKKYQYQLQNNDFSKLVIFEKGSNTALAKCDLNLTASNTPFASNSDAFEKNCFLLGLCYYLSLPSVKENTSSYVTAGA